MGEVDWEGGGEAVEDADPLSEDVVFEEVVTLGEVEGLEEEEGERVAFRAAVGEVRVVGEREGD